MYLSRNNRNLDNKLIEKSSNELNRQLSLAANLDNRKIINIRKVPESKTFSFKKPVASSVEYATRNNTANISSYMDNMHTLKIDARPVDEAQQIQDASIWEYIESQPNLDYVERDKEEELDKIKKRVGVYNKNMNSLEEQNAPVAERPLSALDESHSLLTSNYKDNPYPDRDTALIKLKNSFGILNNNPNVLETKRRVPIKNIKPNNTINNIELYRKPEYSSPSPIVTLPSNKVKLITKK
tara:strand:- start:10210 stop:10929 length:720 start_codon:yes stop_codon:yes gene_type:complete